MKNLLLYGASNFGDEVVQLFRDINDATHQTEDKWNIIGFLDDDKEKHNSLRNGIKVLGGKNWLANNKIAKLYCVCCIGNPINKKKTVSFLSQKGIKFTTGIHPSVIYGYDFQYGEGTIITAGNIITTNVKLGKHIIINLACTIGHYTKIGDFTTINPGVNISGDVQIGEGVLLGTNSTILEKKQIGKYSILGAGAVITKDIGSHTMAYGIPAKKIKSLIV